MTGNVAALILERAALLIPQWRQVKYAQGKQANLPDNWPVTLNQGEASRYDCAPFRLRRVGRSLRR
jgi:hypothetical protein